MTYVEFSTNDVASARRYLRNGDTDYLREDTIEAILDCVRYGHGFRVRDPRMYNNSPDLTCETVPEKGGEAERLLNRARELQDRDYRARPDYVDWSTLTDEQAIEMLNTRGADAIGSILIFKRNSAPVLEAVVDYHHTHTEHMTSAITVDIINHLRRLTDDNHQRVKAFVLSLDGMDADVRRAAASATQLPQVTDGLTAEDALYVLENNRFGTEGDYDYVERLASIVVGGDVRLGRGSKSPVIRGMAFARAHGSGRVLMRDLVAATGLDMKNYLDVEFDLPMFLMGMLSMPSLSTELMLAAARTIRRHGPWQMMGRLGNHASAASCRQLQAYLAAYDLQ